MVVPVLFRRRLGAVAAGICGAFLARPRQAAAASLPPALYSSAGQYIAFQPKPLVPTHPIETSNRSSIDFGRYRGKVVIVNFWATWCPPCVHEMPALDRLAESAANTDFVVLPIAIDDGGESAIRVFYHRLGLTHLGIYVDPHQKVGSFDKNTHRHAIFPLHVLPTTYFIDPSGHIAGYIPGVVQWESTKVTKLLRYLAAH